MIDRRVAIVTINDDTSYGNRLQNFALQEVVRSLGWEPETLRNRPPAWDPALRGPRIRHELRHDLAGLTHRTVDRARHRLGRGDAQLSSFLERRRSAIGGFALVHIQSSPHAFSEKPVAYWADRYARAIAGSDQVWNPTYRRAQGIDFLDFVGEPHRIAFAASFGVEQVPGFLRDQYRAWLLGIPHLSVRESAGRRIVAELTGREIRVVLDPTLTVGRTAWDALVAEQPPIIDVPYAVRFFLGRATPAQDKWVRGHATEAGLAVIDMHDLDHEAFADVDPAAFVAAISRADILYTDSFHAGIFALLHHRPIVLRSRFDRDARWEELLSQHALTLKSTGVAGLGTVADADWAAVDARREILRTESLAFLRDALESSAS
jgi:Polysaccharide pyruvyl transferase